MVSVKVSPDTLRKVARMAEAPLMASADCRVEPSSSSAKVPSWRAVSPAVPPVARSTAASLTWASSASRTSSTMRETAEVKP